MTQKPLTYTQIRKTAQLYNQHKGNITEMDAASGIARPTLQHRIRQGKKRHPNLFKDFPVARGGQPPAAKPERTVAQDAELHRAQAGQREAEAKYRDVLKELNVIQDRLNDLEWANNVSFKPAAWTLQPRVDRKREHTPELFTSDFQVGEVVRANETEAGYDYNVPIFRERYRRMIDTAIYLATHHGGSGWQYPGILYLRGGDTLDGNIHPEDAGEQTLTPLQCVEVVAEEEAAGVEKLAEAFGRVEVKTPGAAGNHDRTNRKPVTKKAFAHSYDRLIHKMLVNHFRKDKRVSFQTSESYDVRYPIYDQNILLTHGDRMGAGGGTGFIGPAATILKGWHKVREEQAALGYRVHQMRSGHFHYPMPLPFGIANGCMPGYSEFAKSFRMLPTPPIQYLTFHHHKRGLVDIKPLVLVG